MGIAKGIAMTRDDVIRRLLLVESDLRAQGIATLFLFGSRARGDAGPNSDLDIFFDPADEPSFDLAAFDATYTLLERAFPEIPVGYSTRDGLVPVYRPHIERDAIRVF